MYAPGGPVASALQSNVATIAMTDTASTPNHGTPAAQSPNATAAAKPVATTARWTERLTYGLLLPYSAVKPPMVAVSPAVVSPSAHPIATGAARHSAARAETHHRPGGFFATTRRRRNLSPAIAAESND